MVYVFCRVRPNAHDEFKDEMCEDMLVTDPMLALLISNRHIQAASIILESPSRLTPNPMYQLRAFFVNYVPLFVDYGTTTWLFGALCSKCYICELSEVCWSCMNVNAKCVLCVV
jgi:hypothetical protein